MSKTIGWDRRLSVSGDGRGLVGHAGAVLLRACADRTGLTAALGTVLPSSTAATWWDRGVTLVQAAVAIVLGAVNCSDVERLWLSQAAVFGVPPSDSTIGRTLAVADEDLLARIAKVRARVRRHVWGLLCLRPGGFPWLVVAGKRLTGWIVIDSVALTGMLAEASRKGVLTRLKQKHGDHAVNDMITVLAREVDSQRTVAGGPPSSQRH